MINYHAYKTFKIDDMSIKFRSDINGLRALAVISVVLYHFNVDFLSGGFVGVDIFFVISGFLMTKIILGKIKKNEFSIIDFYFDRARRIIPALSFLCVVLCAVCWFILLPVDYEALGKHIYSSMLFLSNIEYFHEINYFDASANKKWLLHTWSLSVEWQFYIIYPVVLMFIRKAFNESFIKYFLITSFSLSLFYSVCLSYSGFQSSAFYLLPSRAWEMLAGGIIYFSPNIASVTIRRVMHYAGIFILLFCIIFMNKFYIWPGYLAIAPVVGTMIILASNLESKALTNALAQFIGKISYSVYLWHWPVVVGLSYFSYTSKLSVISGVFMSMIFGIISFYLIENTARKVIDARRKDIKTEITSLALVVSIPFILGFSVNSDNGVPSRYPFSLLTSEQISQERARYWVEGDKESPVPKNGDKLFVIIGNSHGIDLTYSLIENGFKGDIRYIRTTNLCSNFGKTPNTPENKSLCLDTLNKIYSNNSIKKADAVILHDDWAVENISDLKAMLSKIRELTHAKIYVVGPKMMFTKSPSEIAARAMEEKKFTIKMINEYAREFYVTNRFTINSDIKNEMMTDYYKTNRFTYIDAIDLQCGKSMSCDIIDEESKKYYYFDPGHFTSEGAKNFGKYLKSHYHELFPNK